MHLPTSRSTDTHIASATALAIVQQKEWGEILTGWDTRNRYQISDANTGVALGYVGEVGGGWLRRGFLGSMRPFTLEVRDLAGELVLTLQRPWRWFFHCVEIRDRDGALLGRIERRWALVRRKFDVLDATGERMATLFGPVFRPWTFYIRDGERELGTIRKRWSGAFKELFTAADTFGVELDESLAPDQRLLMLGATLLIDFVHFESSGGGLSLAFDW